VATEETSTAPLRFGIVGLGQASAGTTPAVARHPGIKITAAVSSRADAREGFTKVFEGAETFATLDEMCASPNVDALYLGTPTPLHTEHVLLAAQHGKHILCEKPVAVTLQAADTMIEAVERYGVKMVVGPTQGFEPPARKIRELVKSGELGQLRMINSWYFNDWIYRPRLPSELDSSLGGGVVFRQGAHHFDMIRYIGGGLVKSVRAVVGVWDPARPTEGSYQALLEFETGAAAMLVFNGYDHFNTVDLTGIGEGGEEVKNRTQAAGRKRLATIGGPEGERALKAPPVWGEARKPGAAPAHQSHFGLTVVSLDQADIRQSPDGLLVYGNEEITEIPLEKGVSGRDVAIQELYDAVIHGKPPIHDGRWAKATLEVSLAVLESGRSGREVTLQHQVALAD
jgi:phthalate 4,5-cis-dihydrodiol dehydrogenase